MIVYNLEVKIKELLIKKNISIERLAVDINISRPTIHKVFNSNHVNTKVLSKIAEYLNTPMSFFFEENTANVIQNGTINLNGKNTGSISISEARHEIDALKNEVLSLKEVISGMKRELELKDQIIELMKESKNLKLMKNGDKKKLD